MKWLKEPVVYTYLDRGQVVVRASYEHEGLTYKRKAISGGLGVGSRDLDHAASSCSVAVSVAGFRSSRRHRALR